MFGIFSGRIVKLVLPVRTRTRTALENWLNGAYNKTAIATYVASILEAEGLAYRLKNAAKSVYKRIRLELDYESVKAYQEPVVASEKPNNGGKSISGDRWEDMRRLENNGRVLF